MFEKRDIKDFLIAAKDELPKEERLKVVRHFVEDLSGGVNTLKEEVGELFSEELTVERVDAFVNFLKKMTKLFLANWSLWVICFETLLHDRRLVRI